MNCQCCFCRHQRDLQELPKAPVVSMEEIDRKLRAIDERERLSQKQDQKRPDPSQLPSDTQLSHSDPQDPSDGGNEK